MASTASSSSSTSAVAMADAASASVSQTPEQRMAAIIARWSSFSCPRPEQLTRSVAKLAQTRMLGTQFLRLAQLALPHVADVAGLMTLVEKIDRARDDDCCPDEREYARGFLLRNLQNKMKTFLHTSWLSVPVAAASSILSEIYPPLLQLLADAVEADCAQPVTPRRNVICLKVDDSGSYLPLLLLSWLIPATCDATWVPTPASSAAAAAAPASTVPAAPSAERLQRAEIGWQALKPHVTEVLQLVSAFLTSKSPMRAGHRHRWQPSDQSTNVAVEVLLKLLCLPAMKQWLREEASVKHSLAAHTVQTLAMQLLLWMEDAHLVYSQDVTAYECQQSFLSRGLALPPEYEHTSTSPVLEDPRVEGVDVLNSDGFTKGAKVLDALLSASAGEDLHSDALSTLVWTHCSRTLQRAAAASSSTADSQPVVSDLELRASIRGIVSLLTARPRSLSPTNLEAVTQCLRRAFFLAGRCGLSMSRGQANFLAPWIEDYRPSLCSELD